MGISLHPQMQLAHKSFDCVSGITEITFSINFNHNIFDDVALHNFN